MGIGKRIKEAREAKNYTQKQLSEYIGVTSSAVANYENDNNMPSIEILNKLSEIFNCSIDYLLGKSDIRNSDEQQYYFAYHKEMAGLTPDEIVDALKFYKEMKNKINKKEQ